jgi:CDP-paratose 2-epimerase
MKILITGACGFAGAALAHALQAHGDSFQLHGLDNLSRPGSEHHRQRLQRIGIPVTHGDLRLQSDVDALPPVDWIIDCAANPSVLAGADGRTTSRQLIEHNLFGTVMPPGRGWLSAAEHKPGIQHSAARGPWRQGAQRCLRA